MSKNSGQLLLIGFLLIILSVNMFRTFFPVEESPVFFMRQPGKLLIELGYGFPEKGIHQFIDGTVRRDVIKLTDLGLLPSLDSSPDLNKDLIDGERIDLEIKNTMIEGLRVSWMSAGKRVAAGVPLHPDRMNERDWQLLPGIGESMAQRIEINRQKYGDFGSFSALARVPGIGKKRLNAWNQYFFSNPG